MAVTSTTGELSAVESVSIPVPHKVPFRQGATWIQHAFFLVREQPLTWLLFAAMYGMIQLTVAALPVVGQFLSMVLVPVFAGGFVLAAAKAMRGEQLRPLDLFLMLKPHWQRLVMLGIAYFGLLVLLLMMMAVLLLLLFGDTLQTGQAFERSPVLMLLMTLLMGGSLFVASLSYWFAPAEIVLRDGEPLPAMRYSARAGMANWGAMLYCGLILAVLFGLALLPFGLGLLLWLPVMFVTVFMAWHDVCGDGMPRHR
ncbi:hypothetical protein ACG97_12695 [Vogesella sp. EB]|nr:hypothetical protein ACG97_12695 [Vogesella sp. EB]